MENYLIDNAVLLTSSEKTELVNFGFDILKREVGKGNYQACVNLLWVCDKHDGAEPFTQELRTELLKKIIRLHNTLTNVEDLVMAGTLCCSDPQYGWLLENGDIFNFYQTSQVSIIQNQELFKISQLKGLELLEKASLLGSGEAFWSMYEYTRNKNPLNFNRRLCLENSANKGHILAMLELAEIVIAENDKARALFYIQAASELGNIEAKEWLKKVNSTKGFK